MTVEAAGFINDIDPTQPPGTDNFSEGDDHLRNFKKSVQDSLPNIAGAMTATHTELNTIDGYAGNTADLNILSGADAGGLTAAELLYVAGVTSDIQAQFTNLIISSSLEGVILSNDTDASHDINITAGSAADSALSAILSLATEMTKQIDSTWAAGDDAGGIFSGSVAIDTWYHVFLIEKDSDGSIDAGFDTSVTAANIPTGYTAYRRIGSILTDGSANILGFSQKESKFLLDIPLNDYSTANPGTSAVTPTVTSPLGVQCDAIHSFKIVNGTVTASYVILTSPDQTNTIPSISVSDIGLKTGSGSNANVSKEIRTNTSSQIRYRLSYSHADIDVYGVTFGWVDNRGQS